MLALTALAAGATTTSAQADPDGTVVVAVLPFGTDVEKIAEVPGMAPGLVSAGLGSVPITQTFLDIGQGNRVNKDLYDGDLPGVYVRDGAVPPSVWKRILDRAESAPARIEPGLLASTLKAAGFAVYAEDDAGPATLIAVDGAGRVPLSDCEGRCGAGLSLVRADADELAGLAAGLGPDDMLFAIAAGAASQQQLLPAGIVGPGYDGDLTSASTRTDGVVLSTDIAPTVLEHLGVEVPDAMNGSEIVSADERDPEAVADLQDRLDHRPSRDESVLMPLGIWLLLVGLASAIWGRRGSRPALRLLALSCAWAPLLLLPLAGLDAGPLAAGLSVGFGAPALAFGTDRLLAPVAGLALACGATVVAYAVDVIAGSPLTALSILGPNPGGGVRFFGIGNELEAILTTLTMIGTGAWLETRRGVDPRRAAITFVVAGVLAVGAFAPGSFGADVGAAIVLGVGAATAAVLSLGLSRGRAVLVVIGGGALALAALVVVDLLAGGAHLTRSVLGAGDTGDLLDVFDRRLRLMTRTFIHPVYPQLLAVVSVLLVAGVVRRDRVLGWFGDREWARNGFLGALAGVVVGTVANDSGSVLLVIGTIYLTVAVAYYWAVGAKDRTAKPEDNTSAG